MVSERLFIRILIFLRIMIGVVLEGDSELGVKIVKK